MLAMYNKYLWGMRHDALEGKHILNLNTNLQSCQSQLKHIYITRSVVRPINLCYRNFDLVF